MKSNRKPMENIVILLIIGFIAGVLSGFVGLGGGVVIVPALVLFMGMSQHDSQGTALAMMLPPIGILAVMNYYKNGYVNMKFALILAAAFIVGGYFGSKFAIALPSDQIKKIFGIFILLISLKMIFGK